MGDLLAPERILETNGSSAMKAYRRRVMSTAISLAEVPRPLSVESEVLKAIDARQKLLAAIESEKQKRESDEVEFAKGLARDIGGSPTVNVDLITQKDAARKVANDRANQRSEALETVLGIINKRIEQLGVDSPDEVSAAFSKQVESLEKTLSEKEEAGKEIEGEIKMLKAEMRKLPKSRKRKR
jgi:preprotein translocase subunit SecD